MGSITGRKSILMTALRVVPAAGLLLFLLIQFSSELIGIAFYAMGRAQNCSFEGAMDAVGAFDKQESVAASMKNLSRLVEKDAHGFELWDTPGGKYWVPAGGSQVLFDDMAEQERGIYSTRNRGVKRGDVVLDCGANIGQYSRVALAAGASKVIAIEPVPSNIEVLRRNLKDEIASGKVVIVEKGVWDKDGSLEMFIEADNIAAHSFVVDREKTGKKVQLPLTTM
ncbi:MAG: FkbM family methyltransferase, partial [Acidobacteria bacterium]|nr:FkbM family methyltransferase [Acidobacteriota bacterium]